MVKLWCSHAPWLTISPGDVSAHRRMPQLSLGQSMPVHSCGGGGNVRVLVGVVRFAVEVMLMCCSKFHF